MAVIWNLVLTRLFRTDLADLFSAVGPAKRNSKITYTRVGKSRLRSRWKVPPAFITLAFINQQFVHWHYPCSSILWLIGSCAITSPFIKDLPTLTVMK